MLRLFRLTVRKTALSAPRCAPYAVRDASPPPGCSIFTTSAPMSARYMPQAGPEIRWASSSTRYPVRGRVVIAARWAYMLPFRETSRCGLVPWNEEITMTTSKTPVMDALVDFVLGLELAAVPPAVVEAANRSMTDWLGTAIRGSVEPLADAIAAVVAVTGG